MADGAPQREQYRYYRIGAAAWYRNNLRIAHRLHIHEFDDMMTIRNEQDLSDWEEKTGNARELLLDMGKSAIASGTLSDRSMRRIRLDDVPNNFILRLPHTPANWDIIDPTFSPALRACEFEPKLLTTWTNNSCAMDSVLTLLIRINAWRLVADQIDQAQYQRLDGPAKFCRRMMMINWTAEPVAENNKSRDLLQQALSLCTPGQNALGDLCDATDMLNHFLGGMPSVSWNQVRAYACCDGMLRCASGSSQDRGVINITVYDAPDLQGYMRSRFEFNSRSRSAGDVPCSSEVCSGLMRHGVVVVDQMPPRLVFAIGGYGEARCPDELRCERPFEALTFRYVSKTNTLKNVGYTAVAAVLHLPGNQHFVARVRINGKIWGFDGMKEGAYECSTWMPVGRVSYVVAIVFEMTSSEPAESVEELAPRQSTNT